MSKRPTLTLPAPGQKLFALRAGSKQAVVLSMLLSPGGATIAELAKATGWEKHSIRGMVSRVLRKKLGLSVVQVHQPDRGAVYKLASARVPALHTSPEHSRNIPDFRAECYPLRCNGTSKRFQPLA